MSVSNNLGKKGIGKRGSFLLFILDGVKTFSLMIGKGFILY
jgi:hypothetical protein